MSLATESSPVARSHKLHWIHNRWHGPQQAIARTSLMQHKSRQRRPLCSGGWSDARRLPARLAKKARYSELDVWPLVVRNGIRNCDEGEAGYLRLIKVAKETCPHAFVDFLFKLRKKLPSLIDDVWSWENVDDLLMASSFTRTDALHGAMRQPCVCGGEWPRLVAQSMVANQLDPADVGHDVYTALVAGRKETTPVVVLAGKAGGEGKSLLLYPLSTLFGEDAAQCSPRERLIPFAGLGEEKGGGA